MQSPIEVRAKRAIAALRQPDASLVRVPNTIRQSIADVIVELQATRSVSADGINLILSEAGVPDSGYLAVKIAEAVEKGVYT